MAARTSILETIKENCGVVPDCDVFDSQLIVDINSVLSTLHQLGYGPANGFEVTGSEETWNMLIKSKRFNFIKNYMILKVHLLFDLPTSSIAVDQMNKQANEYEWRIRSELECYGEED